MNEQLEIHACNAVVMLPRALRANDHLAAVLREVAKLPTFPARDSGNKANLRLAKMLAEDAVKRAGMGMESRRGSEAAITEERAAAFDRWYSNLPPDLKAKLSFDDFKRLGDALEQSLLTEPLAST